MSSLPVWLAPLLLISLCLPHSQAAAQAPAAGGARPASPGQPASTQPRHAPPPPVAGPPASTSSAAPNDRAELQQEEADRRRIQEERRQQALERRERRERIRRSPRLLLAVGYAGGFAARILQGRLRERVRLRAATFGVGYRRSFTRSLGVHVMATGAMGSTAFTMRDGRDVFTLDRTSERMGAGFAAELEAGLLIGTFGSFYIAPLLHGRTWWVPGSSATLTTEVPGDALTRTVRFNSPVALCGLRLLLGFMPGESHTPDIGFGFDFGTGLNGGVDRYMGTFVRAGLHLPRH